MGEGMMGHWLFDLITEGRVKWNPLPNVYGHEKPVPQQWPEKVGLGFALPNASECGDETNCATCATKSTGHDYGVNA
jgi:hypothetical protein